MNALWNCSISYPSFIINKIKLNSQFKYKFIQTVKMQFSRKKKSEQIIRPTGESLICSEMDHIKQTVSVVSITPPSSPRNLQQPSKRGNFIFSKLRKRSNRNIVTEKKPQSLDYTRCYNRPYTDYIKQNSQKNFLGNISLFVYTDTWFFWKNNNLIIWIFSDPHF